MKLVDATYPEALAVVRAAETYFATHVLSMEHDCHDELRVALDAYLAQAQEYVP